MSELHRPDFYEKTRINIRQKQIYEELWATHAHGAAETMFMSWHRAYAEFFDGTLPSLDDLK